MSARSAKRPRDVDVDVPETPRKRRVLGMSTPVTTPTKQKLLSPRTPGSSTSGTTPYSPAKSVLRRSAEAEIVGRDRELRVVKTFMASEEGLLYICGPPGTGKSSSISHYTTTQMQTETETAAYKVINLNCAALKRPSDIYGKIMSSLELKGTTKAAFRHHLQSTKNLMLLILDEVDYLSSDVETMYALFEFGRTSPQLKILGIANALDLTDKTLPLLRQSGIEPLVLRYKPYTPAQITAILTNRIASITLPPGCATLVQKPALDFLGRKVANATGDIRQALDLLRKAIELVESEYRGALSSLSSNTAARPLTPVSIAHVSKVAAASLGSAPAHVRVAALGIHEKAILCTMLVRKTSTLQTTFDAYVALSRRNKMLTPLPRLEFDTVLSGLLDKGLLSTSKRGIMHSPSKRAKQREEKIALDVNEMDLLQGISDVDILKRFFDAY